MCPCAHEHSTTLSTPLRECDRVYLAVRSNALIQGSHMTFLGHISPLPFISPLRHASFLPQSTHTCTLTPAHTSAQPPTTVHSHPRNCTPPFPYSFFFSFLPQPQSPLVPFYTRTASVVGFICFAGGWVAFESGFSPLGFGSAH
jgi:hypothetical protein